MMSKRSIFGIMLLLACLSAQAYTAGKKYKDSTAIKRQTDSVVNDIRQKLTALNIHGLIIDDIRYAPEDNYTRPGMRRPMKGIPSFYRIAITLKPEPQSNIKIEIWLPEKNWNERMYGAGNGGGGGGMPTGELVKGVKMGYASGTTDMGTSPNANLAVNMPAKWADFGYRSTHEMTVLTKALINIYYHKAPKYAYFVGCSTGGQQSLMESQRYPGDYNGIIAGAPASNRTHLHTNFLWNYLALKHTPADSLFTKDEISAITKTIVTAFAEKSGGNASDNFLTDPRLVNFDPATFFKQHGLNLNDKQVAALKRIYGGPKNLRTGEQIYTSAPYGSEVSNLGFNNQQNDKNLPNGVFYQLYWLWGRDYDYTKFDFDKDQAKLDSVLAPLVNANNADMNPFKKAGDKLIMFTGTADPAVPFQDAVNYYDRVVEKQGGLKETQSFFRYFLVPGMGHCGGGAGPNEIGQGFSTNAQSTAENNVLMALIKWVEEGVAPEKIIASGFQCCVVPGGQHFTRPVYPYPKFPKYIGGDINAASSYTGVDHPRGMVIKPAKKYLN
ncbi:MAG TPA: tannase/feruloyl esterase family alpha/beta hydrolase [Mucilaginibacter sp.]|jgi:feruloyl esterase|nr:tannase/feruloyl esterase family alpha/beta hydrolase [Mucilaginibacter sp.]